MSVPKKPAKKLGEVEVAAKEVKRPPRKEVVAAEVKTSGSSRPSNVKGNSSAERVARLNAKIKHDKIAEKIAERRKNSHGIAMDVVGASAAADLIDANSAPAQNAANPAPAQNIAPRAARRRVAARRATVAAGAAGAATTAVAAASQPRASASAAQPHASRVAARSRIEAPVRTEVTTRTTRTTRVAQTVEPDFDPTAAALEDIGYANDDAEALDAALANLPDDDFAAGESDFPEEEMSDFSEEVHNDENYLDALAGNVPEEDALVGEDAEEDALAEDAEEDYAPEEIEEDPLAESELENEFAEEDLPEDELDAALEEAQDDYPDDEAGLEEELLPEEESEDAYDSPENLPTEEDAYPEDEDGEALDELAAELGGDEDYKNELDEDYEDELAEGLEAKNELENADKSAPTEDEILNAFNDDDGADEEYNKPMSRKSKQDKADKKGKKIGKILSKLIAIVATGSMGYLAYAIYEANAATNILAVWQLALAFLALGVLSFLLLFKAFRGKTRKIPRVIFSVLGVILTAVSWIGVVYINDTLAFLNRNLGNDENVSVYNVVVNKSSEKNALSDLKGGIVYALTELAIDSNVIAEAVQNQAGASVSFESDMDNMKGAVMGESSSATKSTSEDREGEESTVVSLSGETSTIFEAKDPAVMIHEDDYNKMTEEDSSFGEKTKVIGQITVRTDISTNAVKDITNTPFIVYISGIDTRTNDMPERSLSDVNMLAVVNPKTRNLLLVSIPRDYYVTIHGTSSYGLKDKLTHAGGLGGVQLSLATIEDFMDVDVNYYARVNFNFLEKLVDAVGGLTIYSDTAFTAWTDHYCKFTKGDQDVDGRCALAFARERHAYSTGDRHRGENQEQVIKLILEKTTQSSTLLSKYSEILSALDGTFETDFNTNDVGEIVKMHMNDMTPWTVTSANLDGTTGSEYVYSSPSQALSVMYPDKTSIKNAQQAIKNVMEGRAADDDGTSSSDSTKSTNTTKSGN